MEGELIHDAPAEPDGLTRIVDSDDQLVADRLHFLGP